MVQLKFFHSVLFAFLLSGFTLADEIESPDHTIELELSTALICMRKTKKEFPGVSNSDSVSWYSILVKPGKVLMQSAKCFVKCFLERSGLFYKEFNIDSIKETFGDTVPDEFLNECAAKGARKTRICSKAFTTFMCLIDNEPIRKSLVLTFYGETLGQKILNVKGDGQKMVLKFLKELFKAKA